ncbi:MAG: relaxase/mobilization nuclease domain-containing protein [Richelia sp. RM2_1_2]|nr:relaxase/mobilization nuclease domain-containing protein [Richelia sp. RM2_1_2]
MLAVIYKKLSFLKTLKYVLGKEDAAIIGKNMAGESPDILNKEFLESKNTNHRVKKHCAHLILSLPKHESVNDLTMSCIASDFLESMGYRNPNDFTKNVPFVAVRHHDKEHEHIHIVASRVRFDGSCVSDSWDYLKATNATRAIAAKYDLSVAPVSSNAVAQDLATIGIDATVSPKRSPSIRQINANHQEPSFKETIGEAIENALINSKNLIEYISNLYDSGVVAKAKFESKELLGFSYAYKGKYVAGNQISRRYSWNNIQAQWDLAYNPTRDYETLKQIAEVALKCKGEELPTADISYIDVPVISPHARLYNEMKAILKKLKEEQAYPDIPAPVEDSKVERLSYPEVNELTINLDKDNQLPKTKKKNNQIEL